MIQMVDIREVIESFFIVLKEDIYVLIRIQALVALVTAMFFVMFILDIYRCRYRSSILNIVFKTVDSLSDRIVVYLIGSMQAAPFDNEMFPVWGIVLVSLRASLGYLSGYGIPDHSRRLSELGNVIKFMGVGVLNGTRGLQFTKPLWSLWALLLVKSLYRFVAHEMAIKSLLHGRNSEFLPEYMRNRAHDREQGGGGQVNGQDYNNSNNNKNHNNNRSNNNEKYLVCGESNKNISLRRPSYTLHLEEVNSRSLITLDKIMGCTEPLLKTSSSGNYKDISLAFALSRLLRCRFEDVNLQRETIDSTRNLITSRITDSQQQLAVTKTTTSEVVAAVQMAGETASMVGSPVVVQIEMGQMAGVAAMETETVPEAETSAETLPEAEAMTEIVSAVETAGMVSAAETEGDRAFKILELELAFTRDYFHTLYPLVFWSGLGSMFFSLLLSMATFFVAFWLAVDIRKLYHLAPQNKDDNFMLQKHGRNIDVLITWLFMGFMMFKEVWEMVTYLVSNWTRLLLVCKYVQSRPWFNWFCHDGRLIRSFYESNIADAWHGCMDQYDFLESCNYKPFFRQVANAISLGKMPQGLDGRKCGEAIKIPKCIKPAILQALRRVDLNNTRLRKEIPSFRGSVHRFDRYSWACLELQTCSQVILVWHIATSLCEIELARECKIDLNKPGFLRSVLSGLKTFATCTSKPYLINENMAGQLETDYHIAISLSRYCAYLQVFLSELLPDSFVVPGLIFEETLGDVREQLRDCNLRKCSYSKLMIIAEEAAGKKLDKIMGMNILQQGATLGKALIDNEGKESRWKILAEVWADLLVHIAPSWNVAEHKDHLESGGEFITLIWALLSHCGIEKSSLWDKDEQHGETSNIQIGPEEPGTSAQVPQENHAETSNIGQINEDGIESDGERNTGNFRRRERKAAQTDTANQTPSMAEQKNVPVHQENIGETSNVQPGMEQQESETSAQVPPETVAETNNIEQLDEDVIENDEEPLSEEESGIYSTSSTN
jgi:hypothetical protein